MADAYVRISTVKAYVKERLADMRIDEEVIDAIDKNVERMLDAAVAKAVADKRKTIKARDIG